MSRPAALRPTVAQVSLDAVAHNVGVLRSKLAPSTKLLAVVKANAYGHGDVQVARAVLDAGAAWLGVAVAEEGIALRRAGITAPILVLTEPQGSAAAQVVEHSLTASVQSAGFARSLADAARTAGVIARVHLCVDTGMHREGVPPAGAAALAALIRQLGSLELEGLWSHLAVADEPGHLFTDEQAARFGRVASEVRAPVRHLANSAATLQRPDLHLDMVRCGIAVYGCAPSSALEGIAGLRPAMRLTASVCAVRDVRAGEGVSYGLTWTAPADTRVATITAGYADGISRMLSNRGHVVIHGVRRPIVGRVTMDQFMVDCAQKPEVAPGDEVVLIGDGLTATEVAGYADTIAYEVLTSISGRVPREYRT